MHSTNKYPSYESGYTTARGIVTYAIDMRGLVVVARIINHCGTIIIDVRDHGAVGDGLADCTTAIQSALRMASHLADAIVHVPSGGIYNTLPVLLPSTVTLLVDGTLRGMVGEDALRAWPLIPPLVTYGRDRDGAKPMRYRALISTNRSAHTSIVGRGTIDGQGPWWWDRRDRLRFGRPHLIEIFNSSQVLLSSVRLVNSAFWTVHPVFSSEVTIRDVTIRAPLYSPNTDGIDPDSSQHVLIEQCDISVGDDHVAIKSGMNDIARSDQKYATRNITVRHNILRTGMGIAVGSETAGGIHDVNIYDNTILGFGWSVGLHLKSAPQRGGVVSRVSFRHNTVRNTTALMRLDIFGRAMPPKGRASTRIRDVEWVGNVFLSDVSRKVRSKFICPGSCFDIRVINNSVGSRGATWQCSDIQTFTVSGNMPRGLSECMRRQRRGTKMVAGQAQRRGGAGEVDRHKSRRWRKFDWRTKSVRWSS